MKNLVHSRSLIKNSEILQNNPTLSKCQISNHSKSYKVNCPHVALSKPNKELMVRSNQLESVDPQKTGMCKALVNS